MRQVALEQLSPDVSEMFVTAQRQRVLITRGGQPYALIVGVEFKDDEDLQLEASPAFWRMIEERRRQTASMSLEEVKAQLEAEEQRQREEAARTAAKP